MCAFGIFLVLLVYLTNGLQAVSLARRLVSPISPRIAKVNVRRPIIAGSRPSPSDRLPVIDLHEPADPNMDPKKTDLNYRRLHKLLGHNFKPEFMAVKQPLEMLMNPNGTLSTPKRRFIPRDLRRIEKEFTSSKSMLKLKVNKKIRRKFQRFLLSYTYCPVHYKWKDMGVRFWPRWVKTGSCYQGRSCSIPSGMKCKPKGSSTLTLLRFHCRGWDTQRECNWIQIQYPVISSCKCGC